MVRKSGQGRVIRKRRTPLHPRCPPTPTPHTHRPSGDSAPTLSQVDLITVNQLRFVKNRPRPPPPQRVNVRHVTRTNVARGAGIPPSLGLCRASFICRLKDLRNNPGDTSKPAQSTPFITGKQLQLTQRLSDVKASILLF